MDWLCHAKKTSVGRLAKSGYQIERRQGRGQGGRGFPALYHDSFEPLILPNSTFARWFAEIVTFPLEIFLCEKDNEGFTGYGSE